MQAQFAQVVANSTLHAGKSRDGPFAGRFHGQVKAAQYPVFCRSDDWLALAGVSRLRLASISSRPR